MSVISRNKKEFASEVKRVAKKYWVQTPNKRFLIEPHFLFPFFQYLPANAQKFIALRWKYSHYRMLDLDEEHMLDELSNIRLLTKKEMKELFPKANIFFENFLSLPKSIIAWEK